MARVATMVKRVAMAAPVLLLTLTIWQATTVRTELAGSLAEGVVMTVACVFWFPLMKEPRFTPGGRKHRHQAGERTASGAPIAAGPAASSCESPIKRTPRGGTHRRCPSIP
jgi:hypothetical protein